MRKSRKKAKMTQAQVAEKLKTSESNLCRLEKGERSFRSETEIVHYLVACEVELDDIKEISAECRDLLVDRGLWVCQSEEGMGDFLKSLVFHESKAAESVSYEHEVVPGLLQTAGYTRAINTGPGATDEWIEDRTRERVDRRRVLRNKNARFSFFIHERALRTEMGDCRVMAEQMNALLLPSNQPTISIHLVPIAARERGLLGNMFRLLTFEKFPPLAIMDAPMGGIFLEDKHALGYSRHSERLADVALSAEQSRMLITALAAEYNQRSSAR